MFSKSFTVLLVLHLDLELMKTILDFYISHFTFQIFKAIQHKKSVENTRNIKVIKKKIRQTKKQHICLGTLVCL